MRYTQLGKTDIEVSIIGLGCYAFEGGAVWGPQDEGDALAALRAAFDEGITLFDTAEAYGDGYSESLIGKALREQRNELVLASKVSAHNLAPTDLIRSCEKSLGRLRTDHIDLYQVHWPNPDIPIEDTIGALEELQAKGRIRTFGLSNFGPRDLDAVLEIAAPSSNQLPYNLLWRAIEFDLRPLCSANGVSIITYCSLMQGLLTGKYSSADEFPDGRARTRHFSSMRPQTRHGESGLEAMTFATIAAIRDLASSVGISMAQLSIAWLSHQPGVGSVLVGARNEKQVRMNTASESLEVSEQLLSELNRITDRLKEVLGKNPDMWQADSRIC